MVPRSDSNSSIVSHASTSQRPANSAQRVLGHAGSAVSKGWAGLRARGVTGSISNMSSFAQSSKRAGMEPSSSWSSGLVRKGSRDRFRDSEVDLTFPASDGPVFQEGVIRRAGGDRKGRVFGQEIAEAGRAWAVADVVDLTESEWEMRRRGCLPALVVRAVEYREFGASRFERELNIAQWRSGVLKKREYSGSAAGAATSLDYGKSLILVRIICSCSGPRSVGLGADLDLRECHPGDLDPHAVSGLFKSYLRERGWTRESLESR